nr:beta-hexosaminidase 2 [Quercus suber]
MFLHFFNSILIISIGVAVLSFPISAFESSIQVWPKPRAFSWPQPQATLLSSTFTISAPNQTHTHLSSAIKRYLNLIQTEHHIPLVPPILNFTTSTPPLQTLLVFVSDLTAPLHHNVNESYTLTIPTWGPANLSAETVWGAMRGLETFSQLVWGDPLRVAVGLYIWDAPLFGHRGIMLDTSRNYYPVEDILRTIGAMSVNKMNVFHWHITDSHSFPLLVPSEPDLAAKGSYGPDMLYTPDDVNKIVQFGLDHVGLYIWDAPLFGHRGIMLDTSRNYYPVEDILRTIGAMSVNKMNVFHWHITDSHSFPLLVPSEPDLAAKGSYGPDMLYTPDDVNKIVQFGLDHGVRIIPEIDSPAHTGSWAEAYPDIVTCANMFWWPAGSKWEDRLASEPGTGHLNPLDPKTYQVLKRVINDVATLFPEPFYHAGADEIIADPAVLDARIWPRTSAMAETLWFGNRDETGKKRYAEATDRLNECRYRMVRSGIGAEPIQPLWCIGNPGLCNTVNPFA